MHRSRNTLILALGLSAFTALHANDASDCANLYDAHQYEQAIAPCSRAAQSGDRDSLYNLASVYEYGGAKVAPNPGEAADLFRRAAEQGDSRSQARLAVMYLDGRGVARDESQAADWIAKAAAGGSELDQLLLAEIYASGIGVPRDSARARQLLESGTKSVREKFYRDPKSCDYDSCGQFMRYWLAALENGVGAAPDLGAAAGIYALAWQADRNRGPYEVLQTDQVNPLAGFPHPEAYTLETGLDAKRAAFGEALGVFHWGFFARAVQESQPFDYAGGHISTYWPRSKAGATYGRELDLSLGVDKDVPWSPKELTDVVQGAADIYASCGIRIRRVFFEDPDLVPNRIPRITTRAAQSSAGPGHIWIPSGSILAHEMAHGLGVGMHPVSLEPSVMQYGALLAPVFTPDQCQRILTSPYPDIPGTYPVSSAKSPEDIQYPQIPKAQIRDLEKAALWTRNLLTPVDQAKALQILEMTLAAEEANDSIGDSHNSDKFLGDYKDGFDWTWGAVPANAIRQRLALMTFLRYHSSPHQRIGSLGVAGLGGPYYADKGQDYALSDSRVSLDNYDGFYESAGLTELPAPQRGAHNMHDDGVDVGRDYEIGPLEILYRIALLPGLTTSEARRIIARTSDWRLEDGWTVLPETPVAVTSADIAAYAKDVATEARAGNAYAVFQMSLDLDHDEVLNGKLVPPPTAEVVQWLQQSAEKGYAPAQYRLGELYFEGKDKVLAKNPDKARDWFAKVANQGLRGGPIALGTIYRLGAGVPQNDEQAMSWYQKAAEAGDGWGMRALARMLADHQRFAESAGWFQKLADRGDRVGEFALGNMYFSGTGGMKRDERVAADLYLRAAEQGEAHAQLCIGLMFLKGLGVGQDDQKAADWLEAAAYLNDQRAAEEIGELYFTGRGVPQNYGKAAEWFAHSAEPRAMARMGQMYLFGLAMQKDANRGTEVLTSSFARGPDWGRYYDETFGSARDAQRAADLFAYSSRNNTEARADLEAMANQGQPAAIANLCDVEDDPIHKFQLCTRASEGGSQDATQQLGYLYLTGQGVTRDPAKGLLLIRKSADEGFVPAMNTLGDLYLDGQLVAQDRSMALRQFEKTAALGNGYGRNRLGEMYAEGNGVGKDLNRARDLWNETGRRGEWDDALQAAKLLEKYNLQ